MDQTVFFQEGMTQLFGNKSMWKRQDLQQWTADADITLKEFMPVVDELIKQTHGDPASPNKDIMVAALAHLFFLGLPREDRYATYLYDLTYLVRTHETTDEFYQQYVSQKRRKPNKGGAKRRTRKKISSCRRKRQTRRRRQ